MQGWGACGGYSTSDAQKRPVLSTPTQPWSSNVGTPIARHSISGSRSRPMGDAILDGYGEQASRPKRRCADAAVLPWLGRTVDTCTEKPTIPLRSLSHLQWHICERTFRETGTWRCRRLQRPRETRRASSPSTTSRSVSAG